MNVQAELLAEVEIFLSEKRMPATTFGLRALNDGKFVRRLRDGSNMTLATIARVRQYIRDHDLAEAPAPPPPPNATPEATPRPRKRAA